MRTVKFLKSGEVTWTSKSGKTDAAAISERARN